ncbi:MAG: hypothetical protein WBQ08_21930 [Candidatus Sulfotelmatobacter sp.]
MTVREERSLSPEETTLVEWLVEHGRPDASQYGWQVPKLRVFSRCGCGCPTIDFAIGETRKTGASHIIADGKGKSPEGAAVGVILHVREGEISELEAYSITGEATVFTLPKPDSIVLWPD